MKWKTTRETIYEEKQNQQGIRLQVIYMKSGHCEAKLYQELIWGDEGIELNEYTDMPKAWKRLLKINDTLYFKNYYKANKEKMNNYSKEWKKNNKEKWNQYQRERSKRLRDVQKVNV